MILYSGVQEQGVVVCTRLQRPRGSEEGVWYYPGSYTNHVNAQGREPCKNAYKYLQIYHKNLKRLLKEKYGKKKFLITISRLTRTRI